MRKQIIKTENAPMPIGPYSQAVRVGNMLYASGQIALKPGTDCLVIDSIEGEVHQVMNNIKAILEAVNISFDHVIKTSIFIKNMEDFPKINQVYGQYFGDNSPPARETVEVSALPKNVNVEISFIASFS